MAFRCLCRAAVAVGCADSRIRNPYLVQTRCLIAVTDEMPLFVAFFFFFSSVFHAIVVQCAVYERATQATRSYCRAHANDVKGDGYIRYRLLRNSIERRRHTFQFPFPFRFSMAFTKCSQFVLFEAWATQSQKPVFIEHWLNCCLWAHFTPVIITHRLKWLIIQRARIYLL